MMKKAFINITAYLLCLCFLPVTGCSKKETGNTDGIPKKEEPIITLTANYYIDAVNGNDANNGTSKTTPWKTLAKVNAQVFKPGDSVLLKSGSVWESSRLALKGSGKIGSPIVLSSYGSGNKPYIKGNGAVDQVVLLEEVDNWNISNLEISNQATQIGNRTGILIKSALSATREHFHINNVYIHDVMGDYSFETKGKNTGGIGIIGGVSTRFNGILIENCEIGPVNRVGIFTNLTNSQNATRGNRPITNLVIRYNKIHHCAGDGAIIRYAYKPVIAHNIAYENHNASENLVDHGVALWCRSTDEALFEYNEVYNTRGSMDGQAFDADLDSYKTIVQYNYSHDNEGGFMLVYGSSSEAIVRYNISANDGVKGKHIFDFPIWTSPRGSGVFHNNTIIIPVGVDAVIADEALQTAKFYNNIFYNQGSGKPVVKSGGVTGFFLNNAFTGYLNADIPDTAPLLSDPQFVNATSFPIGIQNTQNFKLKSSSALLDKGVSVSSKTTYWLPDQGKIDFSGTVLKVGIYPVGVFVE